MFCEWDCKGDSAIRKDFSGIEKWNTSNVENMEGMFKGTKCFDQPIGKWDVSNVKYVLEIFDDATSFHQDLSAWGEKNPFR